MKKLSLVLSLLMVATISFAQAPGGQGGFGGQMNMNPEDMAKRQAERLQQQLELNKTQYDSLYVFFLAQSKEQQKQREQMMNQGGGQPQQMDMEAMMERFQKQREVQEAKLKTILTEAQFKKYQDQQAEMRANGGGFGGGFGGGQGMPGGQGPRPGAGAR